MLYGEIGAFTAYQLDGVVPSLISGFTNLGTGSQNQYERISYKVATGSESGVIHNRVAASAVIRNGSAGSIAGNVLTATINVPIANSIIVVMGWSEGDGGNGVTISAPSGWTRHANTSPGNPGSAVLSNDTLQPAGSFSHAISMSSYSWGTAIISIGP